MPYPIIMKSTLLLLLLFVPLTVLSQTTEETLTQSTKLVSEKKYNSAFELLEKADPKNNNADILLAKENIVLGYFVTSIMHQMFALKDLQKNEDITDYRGKEGTYSMHVFRADSLLSRLIKTQPNNYKLYAGLGNYYYEVFLHYNANWIENAETLFKLIEENYSKAISIHQESYMTYYELGYINLLQKKYPQAVNYFDKSIELNDKYGNSSYNLAFAYLYQDDKTNALKYAIRSIDLYDDKAYKGDAARMTAEIYGKLNDRKNEIRYYELSDKIDPHNYYTLKALLATYLNANDLKAKETLNIFYLLAPENPTIYNDLTDIYANKSAKLTIFYESQLSHYNANKKVYGNLNFYLAQLYIASNKSKAKECLLKAKSSFEAIFAKDNDVFKTIDTLMKQAE
jgi:tetratricopeptide (TPR) repeat protein